jgi:hypothetical protein
MCFLVLVNPLQGNMSLLQRDTCPRTPGLDERKRNITSQRLKGSWSATNADTCALGEVRLCESIGVNCCR